MARSGLRSHLSGSLPISIALHLAALLALFVVPLMANVVVPTITEDPGSVVIPVAPPPPPPVEIHRIQPSSAPNPAASNPVPTHAPDRIVDEPPVAPSAYVPTPLSTTSGIGIEGGFSTGAVVVVPPPPAPPKPQGPIKVADLPVPPRKIVDVRPIYPEIARAARVEGLVVLEAVLDPSGQVTQLRIIRSVPMLDQAAMDAVRQWRYTPTMYYGKPVSVLMSITIKFSLQ